MKHYLAAFALLALAACSKKEDGQPIDPPPVSKPADSTNLVVNVHDATQWTKTDPYGKLRAGVTVTLYKSREDFNAKKTAYETKSDAAGKASFGNIPAADYYIVAKLDTLSSIPVATGVPSKGYPCDTLYQEMPAFSAIPANVEFPYPGSFIYRDLNSDGKLDQNDMVPLPADHIKADSAKTTTTRILVGVLENCNYKPFATAAAVKEEIDNLYNEVHTWHQQQALFDAVYTDDANCSALTDWCTINQYKATAAEQKVNTLWTAAYNIISRANRFYDLNLKLAGLSAQEETLAKAETNMIRAYVYDQLAAMFGNTLQSRTVCMPVHITNTTGDDTRQFCFAAYRLEKDPLPHLSSTSNRSHFTYEAALALYARAAWRRNNDDLLAAACLELLNNAFFKADAVKDAAYSNPSSTENLWCDSRVISNTDLKTIFKKGNYAPEIHYSEVLLIQAVAFAYDTRFGDVVGRINTLRGRHGQGTLAAPTNRNAAMDMIRAQYQTEMGMEGLTLSHITHYDVLAGGDLITQRLTPLTGFTASKVVLPIPIAVLNQYPRVIPNVGY